MGEDCLFCRIASKEIPSNVVYEDEQVLAFLDLNPQAPTHVLVIPKRHVANLLDAAPTQQDLLGYLMLKCAEVARQLGIGEGGFRVVANCGPDGGQTVGHLHFHVLGGRALTWPPG
ncbi:MAG: histidine triad nucleotide-binding protein [Armatimonadetes bacterium CG_4_10_14_3_um_filter_66_18]|nr:histidine triad nucleotide-binding protein [Armatimonadota bacterium]OIO99366.1 MAG: histidine triad nucleotide-binding protein [Armatimonadetes bacterium CG2_30_66_41]PIU94784.1 MAG: histidine triad nucleotide-binding protein [Armatimonadetes bacterium CG06_land_8_20_14_3_00_66_21]PIW13685.1 MAG: histidine triad nucleotide-binding protein [Armatimonadetes bacterium CG17_big_fil_post_rev_8_21_14_2_50_66_6]PIX38672.1 MAG: histidine triad nucleotide-binding protein [Armatimonadetes bacterium C